MSDRRAGLAVDRGRDPRAGQASTTFTADRGDAGVRLDVVLRRRLPGGFLRSRTRLQGLIAAGAVSVNGLVVRRASTRLAAGDQVGVSLPIDPEPAAMVPQAIGNDVLY